MKEVPLLLESRIQLVAFIQSLANFLHSFTFQFLIARAFAWSGHQTFDVLQHFFSLSLIHRIQRLQDLVFLIDVCHDRSG